VNDGHPDPKKIPPFISVDVIDALQATPDMLSVNRELARDTLVPLIMKAPPAPSATDPVEQMFVTVKLLLAGLAAPNTTAPWPKRLPPS